MYVCMYTYNNLHMDKEGERRKRKMDDNEEENEDEKMEKFFALIRSTRMVKESIAAKVDRVKEEEERQRPTSEEEKLKTQRPSWFPRFQPEDFMVDFRAKSAAHATEAGPSTVTNANTTTNNSNKENKGKDEDDNLDLKLSL